MTAMKARNPSAQIWTPMWRKQYTIIPVPLFHFLEKEIKNALNYPSSPPPPPPHQSAFLPVVRNHFNLLMISYISLWLKRSIASI